MMYLHIYSSALLVAIPLLGIFPKGLEPVNYSDICTPMFIAAQFTIARLWSQPRCPSTDEWVTKLWEIHTMEFYSAIKKNKRHYL